jgi:hypothetical protein
VSGPADSGVASVAYCQQTCNTVNDCATPGGALHEAANWQCTQNRCHYQGCRSDSECVSVFHASYVCRRPSGSMSSSCEKACATPNDCAVAGSPLFSAANYACVSGGCEWRGCLSSGQCRDAFHDQSYVCEPVQGLTFNNCVKPCSAPASCASMLDAYDEDNWSCVNARCRYLGCFNTDECTASFPGHSYICE